LFLFWKGLAVFCDETLTTTRVTFFKQKKAKKKRKKGKD
jgi:hypothetical protein